MKRMYNVCMRMCCQATSIRRQIMTDLSNQLYRIIKIVLGYEKEFAYSSIVISTQFERYRSLGR